MELKQKIQNILLDHKDKEIIWAISNELNFDNLISVLLTFNEEQIDRITNNLKNS